MKIWNSAELIFWQFNVVQSAFVNNICNKCKIQSVAFIRPVNCIVRVSPLQNFHSFLMVSFPKTHGVTIHLLKCKMKGKKLSQLKYDLDVLFGFLVLDSAASQALTVQSNFSDLKNANTNKSITCAIVHVNDQVLSVTICHLFFCPIIDISVIFCKSVAPHEVLFFPCVFPIIPRLST